MKPKRSEVAKRLKEIRTRLNLTIAEFGVYIGNVPKHTVNSWLRGLALPPKDKLNRIALLANTTSDWILWGEELRPSEYKNFQKNYFISYNFTNSNGIQGFGNIDVNIDYGISNIEDLKAVEEKLKKEKNFQNLVILHFKEF